MISESLHSNISFTHSGPQLPQRGQKGRRTACCAHCAKCEPSPSYVTSTALPPPTRRPVLNALSLQVQAIDLCTKQQAHRHSFPSPKVPPAPTRAHRTRSSHPCSKPELSTPRSASTWLPGSSKLCGNEKSRETYMCIHLYT